MRYAGMMLDFGLNLEDIYSRLYLKSKEVYKLQGYVYNNFITTPSGVSYISSVNEFKKNIRLAPKKQLI